MVDQELYDEVKNVLVAGETPHPEHVFKLFEIYKQLSAESEELRAEFEDMDMLGMDFLGEIYIAETDKKVWLSFKDGKIDFGQGGVDNPTLTFETSVMTLTGIIFGTIEISSAHEAGDVKFGGGPEALMDFQAISSVIN